MNKFKVKIPTDNKQNIEKEATTKLFVDQAESSTVEKLNKTEKPSMSFTVPLNKYELELLRNAAAKQDRSMRYISRQLLVKSLLELDLN